MKFETSILLIVIIIGVIGITMSIWSNYESPVKQITLEDFHKAFFYGKQPLPNERSVNDFLTRTIGTNVKVDGISGRSIFIADTFDLWIVPKTQNIQLGEVLIKNSEYLVIRPINQNKSEDEEYNRVWNLSQGLHLYGSIEELQYKCIKIFVADKWAEINLNYSNKLTLNIPYYYIVMRITCENTVFDYVTLLENNSITFNEITDSFGNKKMIVSGSGGLIILDGHVMNPNLMIDKRKR